MKQVEKISVAELQEMAELMYGSFVKGVVDVAQKKLAIDSEMHVDLEQHLLESGSKQDDLWGINLHPGHFRTDDFIEFDSMINIRPRQKNMSRSVEDPVAQAAIRTVVMEKVYE